MRGQETFAVAVCAGLVATGAVAEHAVIDLVAKVSSEAADATAAAILTLRQKRLVEDLAEESFDRRQLADQRLRRYLVTGRLTEATLAHMLKEMPGAALTPAQLKRYFDRAALRKQFSPEELHRVLGSEGLGAVFDRKELLEIFTPAHLKGIYGETGLKQLFKPAEVKAILTKAAGQTPPAKRTGFDMERTVRLGKIFPELKTLHEKGPRSLGTAPSAEEAKKIATAMKEFRAGGGDNRRPAVAAAEKILLGLGTKAIAALDAELLTGSVTTAPHALRLLEKIELAN